MAVDLNRIRARAEVTTPTWACVHRLKGDIVLLIAEVERLRGFERLLPYAEHLAECGTWRIPNPGCTCGLAEK
jgi:hypothetical protein